MDLESLPLEIREKIFNSLTPEELSKVMITSKINRDIAARPMNLKKWNYAVSTADKSFIEDIGIIYSEQGVDGIEYDVNITDFVNKKLSYLLKDKQELFLKIYDQNRSDPNFRQLEEVSIALTVHYKPDLDLKYDIGLYCYFQNIKLDGKNLKLSI